MGFGVTMIAALDCGILISRFLVQNVDLWRVATSDGRSGASPCNLGIKKQPRKQLVL